jgi:hypothetical protein
VRSGSAPIRARSKTATRSSATDPIANTIASASVVARSSKARMNPPTSASGELLTDAVTDQHEHRTRDFGVQRILGRDQIGRTRGQLIRQAPRVEVLAGNTPGSHTPAAC